jgi:DNA polymerase III subunit delta
MPVLRSEHLTRQLREGVRGGVFLLEGQEDYLKDAAVREIADAHLEAGTRDFNVDDVRGGEVTSETLGSLIQTPPMMGEWRVVIVRDAQAMAGSPTLRSMLEAVVGSPPPGLALVLVADLAGSTAKIWQLLKKKASHVAFPRLTEADLPGWLMAWTEAQGIALDTDAARALAAAIGMDLGTGVRELEKLRSYIGDRKRITRTDVVDVVGTIPRQDRWEWINMVAERRFDRARAALPVLLDTGENGVGLVIALATQFLRLGLCLASGPVGLETALPKHQRWLARQVQAQARGWRGDGIDEAIRDLRRADRLLKSAPLTDQQVMEELLLWLQQRPAEAA